MGITEQHARVAVATDQYDFGNAQPHLEEPADRLVPEIMEVQIA